MATFTAFSNILPDPANPITDAGDISASGIPGPGFASLGFQSVTETQVSRTQSGRGVTRDGGSQHWEFTISYNPMFREQFDPIDTFLAGRNPRRDPFYVILPQHSKPKDLTYNGLLTTQLKTYHAAGSSTLLIWNTVRNFTGKLRPGDMFNIVDPNDFNHQKTYKVTGVETNAYYQAGSTQPLANELRIRITPPLQRNTSINSQVVVVNPKFRVVTKGDVQEYSLNTDNLYSFSLALEEIQP